MFMVYATWQTHHIILRSLISSAIWLQYGLLDFATCRRDLHKTSDDDRLTVLERSQNLKLSNAHFLRSTCIEDTFSMCMTCEICLFHM
jgi:hypothetical protein